MRVVYGARRRRRRFNRLRQRRRIYPAGEGWQPAEFGRVLYPGDTLRTGTFGALALLLRDETQIRLQRNTEFVIEEVRDDSIETTTLSVISGALWSRAQAFSRTVTAALSTARRDRIVRMRTKNSTIGIRGTDWYVEVDPDTGTSRVVILSGAGEVFNEFGQVELTSGEEAIVENGKAPNKRVVVDLMDRPLMALEFRPLWLNLLTLTTSPAGATQTTDDDLLAQALAAAHDAEYEQSLALLDKITTAAPSRTATRAALTRVSVLAMAKRFEEAMRILNALPVPTLEAEVAIFRTVKFMQSADYSAGIEYAIAASSQFPSVSTFDTLLANAYLLTDQTDEMAAAIERALAKNPDDYYAWHARGIYYGFVAPDAEEAVASYQRAIEINPNHSRVGTI